MPEIYSSRPQSGSYRYMDEGMTISEADAERIAQAIASVRDRQRVEFRDMDPAAHADHHAFIEAEIEKAKRRKERSDQIKNTVIGALVLGLMGLIGTLGAWVWGLIQTGIKHG